MNASQDDGSSALSIARRKWEQRVQTLLDKSSPHPTFRWLLLLLTVAAYTARVWYLRGFYIISYALGIYNLNLLLGFLTPQIDPELEGPELPTKSDQEFRPFIRRLPEFKFWYASIKSVLVGILLTFFKVFDVPVFWPILLLYWLVLFTVTMKRQIRHMIKYRYIPFSLGKKKYRAGPGQKRQEKNDPKDWEPPPVMPSAPKPPSANGSASNLRNLSHQQQGGNPGGYGGPQNYGSAPTQNGGLYHPGTSYSQPTH